MMLIAEDGADADCALDAKNREKQKLIHGGLGRACGYRKDNMFPSDVADDFNCCLLTARSRHGRNSVQQNASYTVDNHVDMLRDKVRVSAYKQAIARAVKGKRVLDLGCGAFCLLARLALKAGAKNVDAVEHSEIAFLHAVALFQKEHLDKSNSRAGPAEDRDVDEAEAMLLHSMDCVDQSGASLRRRRIHVSMASESCDKQTVHMWSASDPKSSRLQLYSGLASEVALPGPYEVLVHEVLGHIASAEGAALAVADLVDRGLCAPNCIFVPSAAGTLFAPTAQLRLTQLEKVLNSYYNPRGERLLKSRTKYHARNFDTDAMLAEAQPFEWLAFNAPTSELTGRRSRRVVFVTDQDGDFDGFHFHLLVQLDEDISIDTLESRTTWSTTYIKLFDKGLWLPAGTRIVCECDAWHDGHAQCYKINVLLDELGREKFLTEFTWEGCS